MLSNLQTVLPYIQIIVYRAYSHIYHGLAERADPGAEHDGGLPDEDKALHLGHQALHEQHARSV